MKKKLLPLHHRTAAWTLSCLCALAIFVFPNLLLHAAASQVPKTIQALEEGGDIDVFLPNVCPLMKRVLEQIPEHSASCISSICGRRVVDGLFAEADIQRLFDIVNKGMSMRPLLGGPAILDINTGYLRDSAGLVNLFNRDADLYTPEDFEHYGMIIKKLKSIVAETFQVDDLYFTAPTFITRLDASVSGWEPTEVHDEYWHTHADMNNTGHYHYSGLLYMSTYDTDFSGGRLVFVDPTTVTPMTAPPTAETAAAAKAREELELIVEPKKGRMAIFPSGPENPHYVERVLAGQRFVLSFWFTCDPTKKFEIFLDGKAHTHFSHRIRDQQRARQQQPQQQQQRHRENARSRAAVEVQEMEEKEKKQRAKEIRARNARERKERKQREQQQQQHHAEVATTVVQASGEL